MSHPKIIPHLDYVNPLSGNNILHDIVLNAMYMKGTFPAKIQTMKSMSEVVTNANIDITLPNRNNLTLINTIFKWFDSNCQSSVNRVHIFAEFINVLNKFSNFNLNIFCELTSASGESYKLTPLMIAAKHSLPLTKTICSLLGGSGLNEVDQNANTALHIAADREKVYTIRFLTQQHSCKLNEPNNQGHTTLMLLGLKDNANAFTMLLEQLVMKGTSFKSITEDAVFKDLFHNRFSSKIKEALLAFAKKADATARLASLPVLPETIAAAPASLYEIPAAIVPLLPVAAPVVPAVTLVAPVTVSVAAPVAPVAAPPRLSRATPTTNALNALIVETLNAFDALNDSNATNHTDTVNTSDTDEELDMVTSIFYEIAAVAILRGIQQSNAAVAARMDASPAIATTSSSSSSQTPSRAVASFFSSTSRQAANKARTNITRTVKPSVDEDTNSTASNYSDVDSGSHDSDFEIPDGKRVRTSKSTLRNKPGTRSKTTSRRR